MPLRARTTTRLGVLVLDAVVRAGRVVLKVAAGPDVPWWPVQRTVLLTDPDLVRVRRLGFDEHRCRSVRFCSTCRLASRARLEEAAELLRADAKAA